MILHSKHCRHFRLCLMKAKRFVRPLRGLNKLINQRVHHQGAPGYELDYYQANIRRIGGELLPCTILISTLREALDYLANYASLSLARSYLRAKDAKAARTPGDHWGSVLTMALTPDAMRTLTAIGRDFEDTQAVINRILETLLATSESFDRFYGAPADGKGPSGQ